MRVSICFFGACGVGKEVGEEVDIDRVVLVVGGRRLYGGGGDGGRVAERRGWASNDVFGRGRAGW